jgi:hypothetical protein
MSFPSSNNSSASPPPAIQVNYQDSDSEYKSSSFGKDFSIGREKSCDIQIKNLIVSRIHAMVYIEHGNWWVEDNKSGNGTFVDGNRIDRTPLTGRHQVQLGPTGPMLEMTVPELPQQESSATDARTLTHYKKHYFGDTKDDTVGQHTMMVRQAFAEIHKKQKRKYTWIIALVVGLLLITGVYAVINTLKVNKQKKLAADIFYNMRSLEIELAKVLKSTAVTDSSKSREQIIQFKARQMQLEDSYNQFLDTLKVYGKGIGETERLILRMARTFGECEINTPKDFVEEVLVYIEKWKTTQRLNNAIQRAKDNHYTPKIMHTMKEYGLPPHFFYLALQESGFDINACGPKTRWGIAKGVWQFIPTTAAKYGLRPGPLVEERKPDPKDERHHFGRSTLAAARYLSDIYITEAQASGLLVMASYNWGEHRVIDLIQTMPENPRERNFWQMLKKYKNRIPKETYDYVFYIFSAAVIGENPSLFGFSFENPLGATT